MRLNNYWWNISMEKILMNMENSKTNETDKFIFNFSQILDLTISNKNIALQNLSICYRWINMRK